jgi:hypothetical protein
MAADDHEQLLADWAGTPLHAKRDFVADGIIVHGRVAVRPSEGSVPPTRGIWRPVRLARAHSPAMALGSILAEAALHLVGALLEVPVRGLGYALLRHCLRRQRVRWDDHAVLIAGLVAWFVLLIVGYAVWRWARP